MTTSNSGEPADRADPEPRQASFTAQGAAALRAVHQVLDSRPPILDDPISARLLDDRFSAELEANPDRFQAPDVRAMRSHIVLRSRFAEDRLAAAVGRGIRRFVIVGAGLDTFAYRQPAWARDLEIVELDHPASQQAKLERLATAGIAIPTNVRYLALDLETDSIVEVLARDGVDLTRPTFAACLGVLVYVSPEAADSLFRFVASQPPSSELVFTFSPPRIGTSRFAELASAVGEPWRTTVDPEALVARLEEIGFSEITFLTPAESERRYLAGRPDGLPVPRRTTIASVIV